MNGLDETTLMRVPLNHDPAQFDGVLPGDFEPLLIPQLAVDPTDPNRLYIVYHDTVTNDPNDLARKHVNIYLRELTHANGGWTAGPRIQVNDPYATLHESDQFMPSVTVDEAGHIHIIYYDDQNYTDPDPNDPNAPDEDQQPDDTYLPKFDVFYSYSANQGATWTHWELFADPPEPALDFTEQIVNPKEYIGICWEDDLVWTAYTGTDPNDPGNDAVIWSSRIEWP